MLNRVTISTPQEVIFSRFWDLYTSSFPTEERRNREYQEECMTHDNYHLEAILNDNEFVGFIGWWSLDEICYIEHFATSPHLRGNGYGRQALEGFLEEQTQHIILEVEHPTCSLSQRRIGFYSRIGFILNDYHYEHPPYSLKQNEPVSLRIMSYRQALDSTQMDRFRELCFREVHFIHNR
ncbi:MAG: GNAT family N-acetyltransferase [Rikenellaceae bacterium]